MKPHNLIFILLCILILYPIIFISSIYAEQTGIASYYSYECANSPMANGDIFNPEERTCASWFYDFGTVLVIKNLENGRTTEAVVTDRGPNKRYVKQGRIIDLSKMAFQDISDLENGLANVNVKIKSK